MFRPTCARRGVIYLRIIDSMRASDTAAGPGVLFPIQLDMGEGVERLALYELHCKIDEMMSSASKRYGTVKTGVVMNKYGTVVREVFAGNKYIVTGSLRGGYVKNDMRFGKRLTGYNGASLRPGLRWSGEE